MGGEGAEALESLCGKSLLLRTAEGNYGMHDLLREYLYAHLSPAEREENHRRAARFLLEGGQPGALPLMDALRHLMRAGDRDSAARLSLQAGEALVGAGLGPALLAEVLDLIAPPGFGAPPGGAAITEEGWRGLCLLRAGILSAKGEWDRALREYMKAAEGGGPLAADALCGAGGILEGRCDWEGAAEAYSRALSVSESVRPEALRGAARVLWRTGKWKEASSKYAEALRAAKRMGRRDLEAALLIDLGNLEDDRGDPDRALELYSDALGILDEEGISREAARVHNNIGAVLFYKRKWEGALEHYQRSLELAERAMDSSTSAYAQSNIGQILARQGEEARALQYLDASTRTFEHLGDAYMQSTNLLARGILYRTLKDPAKAEPFFRQGLTLLEGLEMPRELAEANFEYALCLRAVNNQKEARRLLETAAREFRRLGAAKELKSAEKELRRLK
jgi:tetratricopeptide (TPR) repeat protein